MKNVIPRYTSLTARQKNKISVSDLFFLNIQSDKSKKTSPGTLATELIEKVKEILATDENQNLIRNAFGNEARAKKLKKKIHEIITEPNFIENHKQHMDSKRPDEITKIILEKLVGLDVLEVLKDNPYITDIKVIGWDNIRVDHIYEGKYKTELTFDSEESYKELLNRFAFASSKKFSAGNPSFDAMFPQMRVNVVGFDLSPKPTLQLRSVSKQLRISKEYMLSTGYLNEVMYNLMRRTSATQSTLFNGETGTGKTELLRYMARYVRPKTDIIMIEDTPESYLDELYDPEQYSITMWRNREVNNESGHEFGYQYHLKNAMRQNPDYIYLQESRGAEALYVLKAVGTGHIVNTTTHSKTALGAINRMIDLCQEGQMQDYDTYGKRIVSSEGGFRIGIHIERFGEKRVRKISQIVEYLDFEDGHTIANILFEYDKILGKHIQKSTMSQTLWNELLAYDEDLSDIQTLKPHDEKVKELV
ncbi:ATPase, T2SS/T4P/T4SS family [Exiguobacterium antarcticum]|uniref:ATPase, T2SS/T4P/T4SS family n=1 Tax=Exiguobacterium antarcticum TaxID=132920 RepID=A0ABT6R640_9BACL|nr:ATPase, T2SS/T4P/T4SS family [Exiguobacterium antarcticum]MDI3236421.1 ATPase, T2SS/T4P/T4SS family [Exiguobacterium antarcticum]